MEVGFGRGVGRKGNGMMRERMKTEEKMRWNTMTLEFESRPCNESFARVSAAAFLAQLNPTVEEVADVKTAISEAVTNAMIHGYRQEKGKIQMKCVLDLEEKVFQVTVKDTGVGIENVEKAMEPMFTTCPELERSGMGFSFMEAFMDNCKEIQSRIESFEHGNLSLKDEEAFTNHILNCADCREEMEIYYIILYGLEDDNEKRTQNSRYSAYLDAFDFTGLVEQKLKDSEAKCLFLRQWTHFTRVRYIFVSTVMVLTALLLIIIKFF